MTSRRKFILESIEIQKSIALLQIVMLLLLKTNHTCVGHGPNCNLKFVKKILSHYKKKGSEAVFLKRGHRAEKRGLSPIWP